MPALTTPAIVLRAVNYGEADRIVTLFGRETGQVSALARSARKSQRRFAGGLGLGAVGVAALRERPGADLLTLESFQTSSGDHITLGADVARLAHAAYAAELVTKLCAPRQVDPAVYDWLATMLDRLVRGPATAERLRVFEMGLLRALGFQPVVDRCAVCDTAGREAGREMGREMGREVAFRWDPDRGGAICSGCARGGRPIGPEARGALARLVETSLQDADAIALSADVNRACREALAEIINQHITGPLKSLEFISKLSHA